jgi:hypothetical protein
MNLQNRIELLQKLQAYLLSTQQNWTIAQERAAAQNTWFTPSFIQLAVNNICTHYLDAEKLRLFVANYHLDDNVGGKNVGIVMAGNIPLVGFHDFLCVFISGHKQTIKLSEKDNVLLKHLVEKMCEWNADCANSIVLADMLKGCDAHIATGSNNSARYFEQYFGKYPNIIRKNRTSVAILQGNETKEELSELANDVHQYFGLGCRNVTKIYVPINYDFVPLLSAFNEYKYFSEHNKHKNNYDYQLSLALLNNKFYMTNGSTLVMENDHIFSPISQLNYSFYNDEDKLRHELKANNDVQCIVSKKDIAFGMAQQPGLFNYADGVDTMSFLLSL